MFAKKSLGQNFLHSQGALRAIIVAGEVVSTDTILEIGPGKGALTQKLLETGAKVIAIEKDGELIPLLTEKFALEIKSGQLDLREGDILELDAKKIFGYRKNKIISPRPSGSPLILRGEGIPKANSRKLTPESYKLIANIPYYITGEIIRKFFEETTQPTRMVLLVEKEVAVRIVAKDNKESILSIACKAYSTPKYIQTVKRDCFNPAPNVDSTIIAFGDISKDIFKENKIKEENFFEVVKLGFSHKRKKLSGNLKPLKDKLNQEKFEEFKDSRAEDLTLGDWVALIKN